MIRLAYKEALKSNFDLNRVGAIISKGGRVLSSGHNSIRYWSCRDSVVKKWIDSLHAEQAAIRRLVNSGNSDKLKGSTIYVYRIKKSGIPGISKPCPVCMPMIMRYGIKKVVYITETGVEEFYV